MYIGVDLGTSFSQSAIFHNGHTLPLVSAGMYGIPSVFYYDSDQSEQVGIFAEEAAQGVYAQNLVRDVKMRLKESFTLDGKKFSSSDIIKSIYRAVIEQADSSGQANVPGFTIDGMVISHPAKFTMQEINLLCEAAKNCIGAENPIKILGTIKEPAAAALSYYHTSPQPDGTNILVFDLGGGTCDLAIVTVDKRDPAEFKVVDSDMVKVGGRDWDNVLVDYAIEKINAKAGKDLGLRNNQAYLEEIRKRVSNAKIALSNRSEATMRINIGFDRYDIKITRDQFEELTIDLLEKTLDKLEEIYNRNPSVVGSIKEIICVGGSSNMPQVKNGIEGRFPQCNVKLFKPEYAVCSGTAIYANRIINGFDFVPFSYGIRGRRGVNSTQLAIRNIITKGARYPITCESSGFMITKGTKGVRLAVYESECADEVFPYNSAKNEKLIGHICLDLPKEAQDNEIISCKLSINALHTIELEAHDETGARVSAKFNLDTI